MKVALIGLGAIGSVIAADIANKGQDIYVVCKHQETLDKVESRGIKISGVSGNYIVRDHIKPVLTIEDLPNGIEVILLITKLPDAEDAVLRIKPKLAQDYSFLNMTNGMFEERLAELLETSKVVGCVVSFAATMVKPGESIKTSDGEIIIGRYDTPKKQIDDKLISLLSSTVPTRYTDNIKGYKYTKLMINAVVASFGVISGEKLGFMMKRKDTRLAFLTVVTEGIKVGKKMGIQFQKLNGLNIPFLAIEEKHVKQFSLAMWLKNIIIQFIGRKFKDQRSSSLRSLERGRPTEIPYLNGYIIQKAQQYGLDLPLNEYIVNYVKTIEEKQNKPSIESLEKLEEKTREIWGLP